MTISAKILTVFIDFASSRASKRILFAGIAAAVVGASSIVNARPAMVAGVYDGTWNVVFTTKTGNCSATNSVPFAVSGQRVSSAGGGRVTGGITRRGAVAVDISVGASHASGSGWLVGNSGTGRWSGIITGDKCSGSWQATRS